MLGKSGPTSPACLLPLTLRFMKDLADMRLDLNLRDAAGTFEVHAAIISQLNSWLRPTEVD